MHHSFFKILLLTPIDRYNIPVIGMYLLVFTAIVFAVVRLSNENYLRQLFSVISFDKNKFDDQTAKFKFSKSSFFLQISLLILFSLGFSILSSHYLGNFNLMRALIGVSIFYVVQLVGFVIFSSIIGNAGASFVKHRLAYNELTNIIFFPVVLVSLYSPYDLTLLVLIVMLSTFFLVIMRISVYLTEFISVFHIILYLCTLEIIPILFLLKFIFN